MEEFFPLPHILLSINVSSTFNLGHSHRDKMESQSFDVILERFLSVFQSFKVHLLRVFSLGLYHTHFLSPSYVFGMD